MGMAITFAESLISTPTDEMMIALLSFKEDHTRWPGMTPAEIAAARAAGTYEERQGDPPPTGWTYFPGTPQLASAQAWLNSRGANGGTNPVSAITEALAENVQDLSIVLITDGEDFDADAFKKAIADGQAARVAAKLGRAVIFVIGTGEVAKNQQHLRDVAESEGGGLYVIRRPTPPEPEKD
jgi:hypothetical protein